MNLKDAFTILKSNRTMDYREVRKSYIDLVSVWHPDRFVHNDRLRTKAIEEMKQINIAWEVVTDYFKNNSEITPRKSKKQDTIIRCNNCGTNNRIPKVKPHHSKVKCGRCGKNFYKHFESHFEEIRFCAIESCQGRIKGDGRCFKCGKSLEEGRAILEKDKEIRFRVVLFSIIIVLMCFLSYLLCVEKSDLFLYRSQNLNSEKKETSKKPNKACCSYRR